MEAFIFDMDGVIINSEPIFDDLFQEIGKAEEKDISIDFLNQLRGREDVEIWEILIKEYNLKGKAEDYNHQLLSKLNQFITDSTDLKPIPGILQLLNQLAAEEITIGLGSAADRNRVEITIDKFKIRHYFKAIVTATDVPNAKPAPDIYLKAAADLKVNPANCWVLEDSYNGILAAKAAGMKCIAYKGAYNTNQDHSKADIRINNISELKLSNLN